MATDAEHNRHTWHSILAALGTTLAVLFGSFFLTPLASAIPPGGASPNTPGTSSSLSPTTVKQCDYISWSVAGFPEGEVVSVKIDDGAGYSTAHGAGVVDTGRADNSGKARGRVKVPCDADPGQHWLRFLASKVKGDDGSTIGYTLKSQYFTVTGSKKSSSGKSDNDSHKTGGTSDNTSKSGTSSKKKAASVSVKGSKNNKTKSSKSSSKSQSSKSSNSRNSATVAQGRSTSTGGSRATSGGSSSGATANRASGSSSSSSSSSGSSSSDSEDATDEDATVDGESADEASGDEATDDGEYVEDEGGATNASIQNTAKSGPTNKDSAIIGMLAAAAILIVGLGGIGAYLWVNLGRGGAANRRRGANNEPANYDEYNNYDTEYADDYDTATTDGRNNLPGNNQGEPR